MKTISKTILVLLIVTFACNKENHDYPKKYRLTEFTEGSVELHTIDGIIANHNYTFDSISKLGYLEGYLMSEIVFTAEKNASFLFPPGEDQEGWEEISKNLNVTYKNDSIFFTKELIIDEYDLSTDVRGVMKNENIVLTGIHFELKGVNTFLWGSHYHPFSLERVFEYIWNVDSGSGDTLEVYHFTLEFAEGSK